MSDSSPGCLSTGALWAWRVVLLPVALLVALHGWALFDSSGRLLTQGVQQVTWLLAGLLLVVAAAGLALPGGLLQRLGLGLGVGLPALLGPIFLYLASAVLGPVGLWLVLGLAAPSGALAWAALLAPGRSGCLRWGLRAPALVGAPLVLLLSLLAVFDLLPGGLILLADLVAALGVLGLVLTTSSPVTRSKAKQEG